MWRGAIQTIPERQQEAGRSLGLSKTRIMISVLLPQAFSWPCQRSAARTSCS
ncbi:hypothetical protein EN925_08305 [Mesorhizobium sp. M7A.F.Ca.US.006.04.2.1]|nr:hypothetical protein EN990_07570 [Mesorhizobium sp. M7A.F.Ca.US.005.03.1.1]RUY18230.1 hypothetical protein EN991_04875 [Mesorhizobium sp. M7A.F.Ca.US.005.03.2.1]RVA93484.1 hypothetical protein EN925_08305 [Mesorhizobium sp. M7A.F.Ca.US.006.04.2.1]